MAVSLYAVERGFIDDVAVNKVGAFESALHGYMNSSHAALMKNINDTGDFSDAIDTELKDSITRFKQTQTW